MEFVEITESTIFCLICEKGFSREKNSDIYNGCECHNMRLVRLRDKIHVTDFASSADRNVEYLQKKRSGLRAII